MVVPCISMGKHPPSYLSSCLPLDVAGSESKMLKMKCQVESEMLNAKCNNRSGTEMVKFKLKVKY